RWTTYDYYAPGVFIMENRSYPHGAAARNDFKVPDEPPISYRIEQQAVTPIDERRTRYLYASGFEANIPAKLMEGMFEVVQNAFAEDRLMIEGQQRILDATSRDRRMSFLPSDKGPVAMRRLIANLIRHETMPSRQQDDRSAAPNMAGRFPSDPSVAGFSAPARFEADIFDCEVIGDIPSDLDGAFYRAAPDWFYPALHGDDAGLFNADGYISMFRFHGGNVDYRGR